MFSASKTSGPSGYNLTNSLRFRASASAYLNRTAGSTTNRQIFTWSSWVKRGTLSARQLLFVSANPVVNTVFQQEFQVALDSDNTLQMVGGVSGVSLDFNVVTTQLFRDPSAWYHIVIAVDTTQATAANRIKLYINGNQVTAFSTATYPAQNYNTSVNLTGFSHRIGASGGAYLDGYLAEMNFVDGTQLTPSSFGETDTTTGSWKPKAYTSTYGTNGFYLKFSDIATTSGSNAGLGKDFSGNANYWTTNNISVTAGVTYDAMIDVPTNTSATVANYAVMNPLDNPSTSNSLANANLTPSTAGASGWNGIRSTIAFPTTGKWYYEVTLTSGTTNLFLGIVSKDASGVYHDHADTFAVRMSDCLLRPSGATATGTQAGYSVGDVFGVAIDCSTPTVQFYKNGSLNVTYTSPTFDPSKTYFPCFMGNDTGASATHNYNFGQRPFTYTPPTGYVRLNTYNLPDSTIKKGNTVMDATLWTGNGSTQVIVNNAQFKPDFVWGKSRSNAFSHNLYDSVRGATKYLVSDSTAAEGTVAQGLTSFNSNGFTLGTDGNLNGSGQTSVGWQWQAGQGTNTSNTSGSITSTVSVNATAGFSIVTYTGTGANATVGHGLGVAPRMIIIKNRGIGTAGDGAWQVYHASLGNTQYLSLNTTAAAATATNRWNNTSPTSTVFTVATTGAVNDSGNTYVAYCWAEIAGFSKFTSYTGNGSADGPMIFTGFRPAFIMIKRTDSTGFWVMLDNKRLGYNVTDKPLYANASNAESTAQGTDFLSNGFKIRATDNDVNTSGGTYIVMAFAANPFKNSNSF